MNLRTGWWTFLRAVTTPGVTQLVTAGEWMYRLNVMARTLGNRHVLTDVIYDLKDALIQHLYQCGYATEVKLHLQKRLCRACGGTGEYFTGAECYRCDGTGVYAYTRLIAFRFCVDGHSFAWHQLEKLIDYPVTFTQGEPEPFQEPIRRDDAILSLVDAWHGCCVVWWALLFNGKPVRFYLFEQTGMRVKRALHVYDPVNWWNRVRARFRWAKAHRIQKSQTKLVVMESGENELYQAEYDARMRNYEIGVDPGAGDDRTVYSERKDYE